MYRPFTIVIFILLTLAALAEIDGTPGSTVTLKLPFAKITVIISKNMIYHADTTSERELFKIRKI